MKLDTSFVRDQFPAFQSDRLDGWSFFENAGGSYACGATIQALSNYYTHTKVQPYAAYPASSEAGAEMDRAHERWAEALGVDVSEVNFGPSTSANTYVLSHAIGALLGPDDEVVVTNQDHEANTGSIRRAAVAAGATLREWRTDPDTGLLDVDNLESLLNERTKLVVFPHCSNIIGQENDVSRICALAKNVGAWTIVDGVSYVPHGIPDVSLLGADIYLFSLYKVYSVHQGVMVIRTPLMNLLPNQAHSFNDSVVWKRLNPAGPDHAQVASSNGVLDYIEALDRHHFSGGVASETETNELGRVARRVSKLWRDHESELLRPVLDYLHDHGSVRLLGPERLDAGATGTHRCPTVAFLPHGTSPATVVERLKDHKIMASSGHYYATRVLAGLDVPQDPGVVRLSWVHYTTMDDVHALLNALDSAVSP